MGAAIIVVPSNAHHRKAAVDGDGLARNEIRGLASQEDGDAAHIIGVTPATSWRALQRELEVRFLGCSYTGLVSSVLSQPGTMQLTWMLYLAQATARLLVSWTMTP